MNAKESVALDAKMLRLVRQRAKKLVERSGFPPSERKDLEQELTLHLLECLPQMGQVENRYAFVNRVLRNHGVTLVRQRKAEKCNDENVVSLNMLVDDSDQEKTELGNTLLEDVHSHRLGAQPRDNLEQADLAHDVATVLAKLPAEHRDLCERLKHQSLVEIAKETGIARKTLYRLLQEIRERFESAGLQNYL